jgi:hypothetical protein
VSTVVAVMDQPGPDANTDVIVVAHPGRRELLWVPRDLWSERYGCRVNGVFALRGGSALLRALGDLGIRARDWVCVPRDVSEAALAKVNVTVPVARPLRYWYPVDRERPIEKGRRVVAFDPPHERLVGPRVHEWLGARYGVGRYAGDIERIGRQQVFLRELLRGNPSPGDAFGPHRAKLSISSARALDELRLVDPGWRMTTVDDWAPETIEGQDVLVARPPTPASPVPEGGGAAEGPARP